MENDSLSLLKNAPATDISNILMIDDQEENLIGYKSVLEKPDRQFLKAHNGKEGIKLVNNHDVSLVLLDVQMPGMTGFEVAEEFQNSPATENIPIIFITGMNHKLKYALKGYNRGAVDYIHKPVNPEFLRAKVNVFLRLEKQRREIERQNKILNRLGQMVNHSADLMCILDKETLVLEEINPAFQKQLGYNLNELPGQNIVNLFAEVKDVMAFEYKLQRYKDQRLHDMHFECRFKSKSGLIKWISMNVTQRFDKWFVNGQDITQLKTMESQLRDYNVDLELLTATISNGVKTPLDMGLHYLNLALKENRDENLTGHLDHVFQYLNKVEKLVDEINLYARSREEIDYVTIPASEIIRDAMNNLGAEIKNTHTIIRFGKLPEIYGIHSQLVILFQNLISNSIKFCKGKTPEIDISFSETKEKFILIYRDNGSGVNKRYTDVLFNTFKDSPFIHVPSTGGIGLKICNNIIKRQGGSISAEARPGEGSTFFISILKRVETKDTI